MPTSKQRSANYLYIIEIFYSFMVIFSFYLLLTSRTGEARTVWESLHPLFIPTIFITTLLLLTTVFASVKVSHKLLFVIAHSFLMHSLFSIIFPAGDMSGQQMVLGRVRLVFDNAFSHGWTWPTMPLELRIFEWFRGTTFQAALSVGFSRMLSIELLWIHLFLVPVLWSVFTPIAAFLTTKTLGGNEKAAVLSSLLISAFPYATYFGAISVPNSLGFIFFFFSLYFMLRNLDSDDSKNRILMVISCFFSFLSHPLTGITSFALLLLALAFRTRRYEKPLTMTTKASLAISFLFCASLLPVSFFYLRLLQPAYNTVFTMEKLYELPIDEIVGMIFLGEAIHGFDLKAILLIFIGPAIALLCMVYLLYMLKRNPTDKYRVRILFLSTAFLMILVDYRILKLFMDGLPLNEERLWVFRDFMAAPFVALAISAIISSLRTSLKALSLPNLSASSLKAPSKGKMLYVLGLLFTLNILIPVTVAGWVTGSLSAAYPQVAPLQTTWYELEAVRYIEANTREKYVVIGDVWTIFAGEVVVGVNNPRAYYFLEFNKTGYDLFSNMRQDPSLQWMRLAMNLTDTTVAYFVVTEPRLSIGNFNHTVSKALQNGLPIYGPPDGFGNGRLYIFYHEKEDTL